MSSKKKGEVGKEKKNQNLMYNNLYNKYEL